ncbi:MAG TPA: multicopper oxidase family protein [Candidatus Dormibacteraeota bacterium]|nr:multicopper oxidase family protein [Candidatus Dormibacteraeota bacterium]
MRPTGLGIAVLAAWLALAVAACGNQGIAPIGPSGGQATPAPGGVVRDYDLVAVPAVVELKPGLKVQAWTYNGTSPGPQLTGVVGDLLVVRLHNLLPVGTTLHFHGLDVPNGEDGVAGITQDAVPPNTTATYSFRLTQAGTYWYHSHQDSSVQVDRGLYGALIVRPRGSSPAGVDQVLIYGDWSLGLEAATPPAPSDVLMRSYVTTSVNGLTGDAIRPVAVTAGQPVRLRLINTGHTIRYLQFPLPVTIAAMDGHELSGGPPTTEAIPLGPAERVDVTFTAPSSAFSIQLVDGFLPDAYAAVPVQPAGATGPAIPAPANHGVLDLLAYPARAADNPWPDGTAPNKTFSMTLSEQAMGAMPGMAMDGVQYQIDGEVFPATPTLHVTYGDRVEITFVNRGSLVHSMHLHGHFFRVLARDALPLPGALVKDTVEVAPGHSVTIGFLADNPGVWMIHCHQLIHAAGGMMALLAYDGAPRLAQLGGAFGNSPD